MKNNFPTQNHLKHSNIQQVPPGAFPLQQPVSHIILSHWREKVKAQLLPCESRKKMFSLLPISCLESRVMPEGYATGLFHQSSQTKKDRKMLGQEGTRHFLGKLWSNQRVEELTHKEHLSALALTRGKSAGSGGTGWKTISWNLEWLLDWGRIILFVLGWCFYD